MEILFPSWRLSLHRFLFVGACIQKSPDTQPPDPSSPQGISRLSLSAQAHRLSAPHSKGPLSPCGERGALQMDQSFSGTESCMSRMGELGEKEWERRRGKKWGGGRKWSREVEAEVLPVSNCQQLTTALYPLGGSPMVEDVGLPDCPQALAQLAPRQGRLQ